MACLLPLPSKVLRLSLPRPVATPAMQQTPDLCREKTQRRLLLWLDTHSWPVSCRTCAYHHTCRLPCCDGAADSNNGICSSLSLHDISNPTDQVPSIKTSQRGGSLAMVPCKPTNSHAHGPFARALAPRCSPHTVGCETRAAACGTACTALSVSLHGQEQHGFKNPNL